MQLETGAVAGETNLISTERVGAHVLVVTINRPDKRNAINVAASKMLAGVVRLAERDDSVRVVILTGAGNLCFSAGADLDDIAAGCGNDISIGGAGIFPSAPITGAA